MTMNSHYKTALFYVSSGTGNSLRVAGWMQQIANSLNIKIQRKLVDKHLKKQSIKDSEGNLVCIFMPTHGFTAPWSVIKFAVQLPRVGKTHAVVVATQGRLQFGKYFIPGLSASSTFIIALILALKGYRVRGVQSINMPSNWMALHSAQKTANIQRIIEKAQRPSEQFISKILSGRRSWFSILNGIELILGILCLPISIGYMIYGKEGLAKLFFTNLHCNGCRLCADNCPNSAILMRGKNQKRPFWTFHCESCMRCMAFCPEKAIEIHQPLAYFIFQISSLGVFFIVLKITRIHLGINFQYTDSLILRLIHYAYYLAIWFLYSKLVFWLTHIPVINQIFNYTTLTVFYRRYREPTTNLKNFKNRK